MLDNEKCFKPKTVKKTGDYDGLDSGKKNYILAPRLPISTRCGWQKKLFDSRG
jgi:hypothetical protein